MQDEGANDRSDDKKYRSGTSITVTGPIIEPYQTYTVSGSGGTPAMTHSYVNNLGGTAYQRQSSSLGGSAYSRGEVVVIPAGGMVDVQYSAQVINQPTKFVIPASDRGALQSVQLEYPRTRMGVTRYDVKHAGEFKL
ncbi:hypothetical protein CBR_g19994 [Chara braunii]|uniref:Uncharacterized protein n=1 Tax=Chara braunii TaxID=69332 RepID=A0A388KZI3_CHABU|nr:hypothetical protein CBR_g19994 [Chara braunii]|eukprot:GBG75363.1 hypothetical protein CBR_g19994 [Chara braunii]